MAHAMRAVAVGLAWLVLATAFAVAAEEPAGPAAGRPVVVLDTAAFWRMHHTLKPPVIQHDDGIRPLVFKEAWLDAETSPPPAGWADPDFDDSGWVRAVALRACKTPYLARLCLRGKFQVTDPSQVDGLALTLAYHGGAVVYVNGKELRRGHLPPGALAGDVLAESYPEEAYLTPDGRLLNRRSAGSPEAAKRFALRERSLEDIAIPSDLLRKGLNVVAVEIIRAPYHKLQEDVKVPDRGGKPQYGLLWNTCEVRRVRLAAAGAAGLVPNADRPHAFQVWNSDLLLSDFDLDFGDAAEPIRPVKIVGVRNGAFSGKFVVGSDEPIRGLRATAGDLKCGDAAIPASAVRIRYAVPWDSEHLIIPYSEQLPPYPRPPSLLGALAEAPLEEFPVRRKILADPRLARMLPQADPVFGAVVPVWLTVSVPPGAKPGNYAGRIRVEGQGLDPVSVPVELAVLDWALPDTQDYNTWVELIQSPDTLAMEYGLDLWSDDHWRMIEQAMRYIGQAGSRVLHIPLLAQTNLGHEQTMVRWIRKADGAYDYDLSIMDRYLDAAEKHMGRPRLVIFWVWDIYLIEKEKYHGKDHLILEKAIAAREAMRGTGPMVTVFDPAAGKTDTVSLPAYRDPASRPLWEPLMARVQDRLKARGLEKAMMLGVMNDTLPSKEEMEFFAALCPGVPWALHAHGGPRFGTPVHGVAPLGYKALVWTLRFSADKSLYGWRNPNLLAHYDRERMLNAHTPALWAHLAELSITGDQRGVGRLGADYWPAVKDKRGDRKGYVWTRYPHSSWRNLDLWSYVLAPGPDGPVASTAFEYFREGVEHCEARIFLEQALLDAGLREKLGDDLARRCQAVLDERQRAMVKGMSHHQMNDPVNNFVTRWMSGCEVAGYTWFLGSGWQERSEKLYALAAEVAKKRGAD